MRQRCIDHVTANRLWHYGCNFYSWRHLVNRIAVVGLAALIALLALTGLFPRQHFPSLHTGPAAAPAMPSEPIHPPNMSGGEADFESEDSNGIIDLYGNEVSPAIATYSFDALGSPYEVHSPQTELPRLGSPKT